VKSRLQKIVLRYGIPLAILFSAVLFSRTAPFWGWHLLHGFHIKTNGVRIWVPLTYRAVEADGQGSIALLPFQGLFPSPSDWVRSGTVMIDFVDSRASASPLEVTLGNGPITLNTRNGFVKKNEREVSMAGRRGHCSEYVSNDQPDPSGLVGQSTVNVYCQFEDVRASFLGSSSNEPKFFEIVASAR
jgi:hypothetical protein